MYGASVVRRVLACLADALITKVNTDGDKKIFAGLNTHKDSVSHGEDTHKVVDKGEVSAR